MTDHSDQTVEAIVDDLSNYEEFKHVLIRDLSGHYRYVGDINEYTIKGTDYVVIEMAGRLE